MPRNFFYFFPKEKSQESFSDSRLFDSIPCVRITNYVVPLTNTTHVPFQFIVKIFPCSCHDDYNNLALLALYTIGKFMVEQEEEI